MSSFLVVVVLVGMWGFVLAPVARRRYDRTDELRSVDRFSSALRVLSRRGRPGSRVGSRAVVMPARPVDRVVGRLGAADRLTRADRPARVDRATRAPRPAARPGAEAATRRRRTVMALLGTALLTLVLGLSRGSSWLLLHLLVDLVLAGVLLGCAQSAQRERDRRARAARRARSVAPVRVTAPRADVYVEPRVVEPPVMTVPLHGAPPVPVAAPAAAAPRLSRPAPLAVVEVLDEVDELDRAVVEPASGVRVLDLTTPGSWTRRRLFDDAAEAGTEVEAQEPSETAADAALERLLERRTAAGGW